ncbi:TonB-dependent receptor [Bacteroides sp. OttesenSCG-928-D19]|nr:TonB-dependent receptor [Bacteroides sp. OttesenSCG-928-N06]MDL2305113.1 TonB-dependent receptor [Bacteroides sp. OttesenSCG-928-D19]
MRFVHFLLSIFLLLGGSAQAQETGTPAVGELFLEQISLFPQEKMYVQTDRNAYIPGDIIWFRAHLVDALLLKQANASRYVYVELIDPAEKIVQRVKLRPDSIGAFHGHIQLDEDLAVGNYTLRSYTWFMQNLGEDYFFTKPLSIINPTAGHNAADGREAPGDFHVSFFPEGGYAPVAANIQMAFKAINADGLHEEVTGAVYDDNDEQICTFESRHLGMGSFRMYYSADRKYYAVCTNRQNVSKRFELPAPRADAVSLKVIRGKDLLRVSLSHAAGYVLPAGTRLVAHIRGAVVYEQDWNVQAGYVAFDRDFFPAGIVHLLLIDGDRNILSERLVFSSQESTFAQTAVAFDKNSYAAREKITLTIKVTDENQEALESNFALAVVDVKDAPIDSTSTIISTLLLTSELKGYIESPMSYLQPNNRYASTALDVLMMTQGWRRYNIPALLKGELTRELPYPVETAEEISGKADGIFSGLTEGGISLLAVKDSVIGTDVVAPEAKGKFVFQNLEYPEGSHYIIQALTKKGSKKVFLTMNPPPTFPGVTIPAPIATSANFVREESRFSSMYQRYAMDEGLRMYQLDEVVVTAKKKYKAKTQSPYYSGSASQVVSGEDVENWGLLSVSDLLIRIPGVSLRGSEVYYRNEKPMFIVDNVPNDDFDHSLLDVNDISDAFALPALSVSAIFGARASGGAIVINTKRGFVQKNKINSNIQTLPAAGYQQTAEFYSPVYETKKEAVGNDLRTTIYWNPCVTTNDSGMATITFYSADAQTVYGVVIEGVSSLGHLIHNSSAGTRTR